MQLRGLIVLVMLCGLMMSCTTTQPTGTTGADAVRACCLAFEPLTYSAYWDTPETVLGVRRFNAAFDAMCRPNQLLPDGEG